MLQFIHWTFEPELFPNTSIPVRWYGILFALAFVVSYLILKRVFKKEGIQQKVLDDLTLYVGLATIIGARLGHCFFYDWDIYKEDPIAILKVWEGGLASHGAAIGILFAMWLFYRKYKVNFMWLLDRLALVIPVGGAFVRLGNLANSEIYGKETDLPWGFYFEKSVHVMERAQPRHPSQIYEALAYLLIFLVLWMMYRRSVGFKKPGLMFSVFLILLFTARYFIEFVKVVQVSSEDQLLDQYGMNLGQLLSVPFIILGVVLLVMSLKNKFLKKEDEATAEAEVEEETAEKE